MGLSGILPALPELQPPGATPCRQRPSGSTQVRDKVGVFAFFAIAKARKKHGTSKKHASLHWRKSACPLPNQVLLVGQFASGRRLCDARMQMGGPRLAIYPSSGLTKPGSTLHEVLNLKTAVGSADGADGGTAHSRLIPRRQASGTGPQASCPATGPPLPCSGSPASTRAGGSPVPDPG